MLLIGSYYDTVEFVNHAPRDSQDQTRAAVDTAPGDGALCVSGVGTQTPQPTEECRSRSRSRSSPTVSPLQQEDFGHEDPTRASHHHHHHHSISPRPQGSADDRGQSIHDIPSPTTARTPVAVANLPDHPPNTTVSLAAESVPHRHVWQQQNHRRDSPLLSPSYVDSETLHGQSPWQLTSPHGPMLMRYFVTDLSKFVRLVSSHPIAQGELTS